MKACDSGDQVVLQWSCMLRAQILREGPGKEYVPAVSAGKKNIFSKVDGKLIFNFKSISALRGPGFQIPVRLERRGRGICRPM